MSRCIPRRHDYCLQCKVYHPIAITSAQKTWAVYAAPLSSPSLWTESSYICRYRSVMSCRGVSFFTWIVLTIITKHTMEIEPTSGSWRTQLELVVLVSKYYGRTGSHLESQFLAATTSPHLLANTSSWWWISFLQRWIPFCPRCSTNSTAVSLEITLRLTKCMQDLSRHSIVCCASPSAATPSINRYKNNGSLAFQIFFFFFLAKKWVRDFLCLGTDMKGQ